MKTKSNMKYWNEILKPKGFNIKTTSNFKDQNKNNLFKSQNLGFIFIQPQLTKDRDKDKKSYYTNSCRSIHWLRLSTNNQF